MYDIPNLYPLTLCFRFDEIHDDIVDDDDDEDDNVINHHGTMTIMADISVGDQQEILEV